MAEEIKTNEIENTKAVENSQDDKKETEVNEPKIEDLMTQLAQERAQRAKDKVALDKALKEAGELKKSLRARQTAEEQEEEAKREREEAIQRELEENRIYRLTNEAKERYLLRGMDVDLAKQCADAEVSNDKELLNKLCIDFQNAFEQRIREEERKELLASIPEINAGGGDDAETDVFKQILNS